MKLFDQNHSIDGADYVSEASDSVASNVGEDGNLVSELRHEIGIQQIGRMVTGMLAIGLSTGVARHVKRDEKSGEACVVEA
jgi:hypothetical protein